MGELGLDSDGREMFMRGTGGGSGCLTMSCSCTSFLGSCSCRWYVGAGFRRVSAPADAREAALELIWGARKTLEAGEDGYLSPPREAKNPEWFGKSPDDDPGGGMPE